MSDKNIIAFSGRKQSGKNTCVNFIYSTFMVNLGVAKKVKINDYGLIEVSDLLGDKDYAGPFDPSHIHNSNDYILQQLCQKMDAFVKVYSFADPLKKDVCMNILGLTHDQCYGSDKSKNELVDCFWPETDAKMTAREVMQYVGTDIFRTIKSDVWTSAIISKIKRDDSQLSLITDCRFPNEVECVQNNNGVVVRLDRNTCDSVHVSETALDKENYDWNKFDYIVENNDLDIYNQSIQIEKILNEVIS